MPLTNTAVHNAKLKEKPYKMELSGERAKTILKKSSSYDFCQSSFLVGKVVTTVFAKSQAVIRRTGDDSFQLIIRRSFSDYVWKWIVDAGSRE